MTRYDYITQQYQRMVQQPGDDVQVQQLKQQLSAYQTALVSDIPASCFFYYVSWGELDAFN